MRQSSEDAVDYMIDQDPSLKAVLPVVYLLVIYCIGCFLLRVILDDQIPNDSKFGDDSSLNLSIVPRNTIN